MSTTNSTYRNSQELNENLTLWGFSSFDDTVIRKHGQLPYYTDNELACKKTP